MITMTRLAVLNTVDSFACGSGSSVGLICALHTWPCFFCCCFLTCISIFPFTFFLPWANFVFVVGSSCVISIQRSLDRWKQFIRDTQNTTKIEGYKKEDWNNRLASYGWIRRTSWKKEKRLKRRSITNDFVSFRRGFEFLWVVIDLLTGKQSVSVWTGQWSRIVLKWAKAELNVGRLEVVK